VSLTVTAYRVLIELDEELDDERLAFGDTIHDYNFAEALPRDVLFVPIGWDPAVPSAQKLLDDDFEQVDFFVLILWDRWPAGAKEAYEFALKCRDDPAMPMRHVMPFFKAVEPRQLSDPGPGLEEVLRLKDKLEAERRTRFESFATLDTFRSRLRWHLSRWLIEHETGQRTGAPEHIEYGLELQRQAMLDQAEEVYLQAIKRLGDRSPSREHIVAYGNLGAIYRRRRKFAEAEEMFHKALDLSQELERPRGIAASYGGLGLLHLRRNDLDKAEEVYRCALDVEIELGRGRAMAWVYENLALVQDLRGDHEKAEELRRLARAVGEEAEYPEGELFPDDI